MSYARVRLTSLAAFLSTALAALALVVPSATAQDICGTANKITRLGNPTTRFSSPVTSVEGLQNLMVNARSEVEALLRQAGFQGDASDFFQAVASAEGISAVSVDPGTHMDWMFGRDKGQPIVKRDVCWQGKAPFRGFEIQFSSQGTWYLFVVPEVCGNLAVLSQQAEPTCKVSIRDSAGDTCEQKTITVDATGSTGNVVVELIDPSGRKQTLTSPDSSTNLRWTVPSDETKGTFKAIVTSTEQTVRGNTLECRAEQSVVRDCCIATPPSISMSAAPNPVERFQNTTVRANPTVSECTNQEAVTIDGKSVTSPYEVTTSYPEPGVYTVDGMVRDGRGQTATDAVDITVTDCTTPECKKLRKAYLKEQRRGEREGRGLAAGDWIFRAWLGSVDMDGDQRLAAEGDRREAFRLSGENGLGAQIERLVTDRIGVGGGLMLAQGEVEFELDIGDLWGAGDDSLDTFTLFVGPVFHLTPDNAVDLVFSPFVGYTDVGSSDPTTLGNRVTLDFDSDFSWGAMLGLDIPIGSDGWGIHAGAIYQALDLESNYRNLSLDGDPLSLNVGVKYTF